MFLEDEFVDELVLFSCNDEIIYRELIEPALQDLRAIYCGRSKTSSWKQ